MDPYQVLITLPDGYIRDTFFTSKVREKMDEMKNVKFTWNPKKDQQWTEEELAEQLYDKDACIFGWGCPPFKTEVLKKCPKLKLLTVLGGGMKSYIESNMFDETSILLSNQANQMAKSVAEAVIAYALAALRDIPHYDRSMKNHNLWRVDKYYNEGLFYRTIGMVGLGQVGRYVIEFLKPFDVNFLIYDPYVDPASLPYENIQIVSLDEAIEQSDIVSIHAGYTPETHHMMNAEKLQKIRDGALLINTARGGIIDEQALILELQKQRFKAVLDVYEKEPLPIDSGLRELSNVILVPHMAGPTIDMRQYMTLGALYDIEQVLQGKLPAHVVTKEQIQIMT
ncbi:MAG: hydroxyacid dehydrogenase [Epulopiscium sp.]|nr:hydroxyacid dehydrogenase [Candidatus Epulonipiscium sp.]